MENNKRKNTATTVDGAPYNKRQRPSSLNNGPIDSHASGPRSSRTRAGPVGFKGLKSAFPGVDEEDDGKLFYGPANDGFDYIRMVRSEAQGVPNLLVAPKSTQDPVDAASNREPSRGYYSDGAYTAAPTLGPSQNQQDTATEGIRNGDAQDAYHTSLLLRFRVVRATLRCTPPAERIATLDSEHPVNLTGPTAHGKWRRLILCTEPLPAQLAAMQPSTLTCLLRVLALSILKSSQNISPRTSRWIWAVLGKLDDVGCLGNAAVGDIRALGKRAVWVLSGLKANGIRDDWSDYDSNVSDDDADYRMVDVMVDDEHDDDHEIEPGKESSISKRHRREQQSPSEDGELADDDDNDDDDNDPPPPLTEDPSTSEAVAQAKARLLANLNRSSPSSPPPLVPFPSSADDTPPNNDAHDPSATEEPHHQENHHTENENHHQNHNHNRNQRPSQTPTHNTLATLDLIITVIGELYGQRDLLEFRDRWDSTLSSSTSSSRS